MDNEPVLYLGNQLESTTVGLCKLVLQNVPAFWEKHTNIDISQVPLYKLYDVTPGSIEFEAVIEDCKKDGIRVTRVKRLQHVTMYGRYLINRSSGAKPEECLKFMAIQQDKIQTVCNYNLDNRRLGYPLDFYNLFDTPKIAIEKVRPHVIGPFTTPVVVVTRVSREGTETSTDSELYPEYFVYTI